MTVEQNMELCLAKRRTGTPLGTDSDMRHRGCLYQDQAVHQDRMVVVGFTGGFTDSRTE